MFPTPLRVEWIGNRITPESLPRLPSAERSDARITVMGDPALGLTTVEVCSCDLMPNGGFSDVGGCRSVRSSSISSNRAGQVLWLALSILRPSVLRAAKTCPRIYPLERPRFAAALEIRTIYWFESPSFVDLRRGLDP